MINKYPYTDFNEYNMDWIIKTVKDLTDQWAATHSEWEDVQTEWSNYKNYIDTYFANLDLSQEVSDKMNAMVADGTLATVIEPFFADAVADIPGLVTTWLNQNITQETGYVLDASLTVAAAAGDAKGVGDNLRIVNYSDGMDIDLLFPFIKCSCINTVATNNNIWLRTDGSGQSHTGYKLFRFPVTADHTVALKMGVSESPCTFVFKSSNDAIDTNNVSASYIMDGTIIMTVPSTATHLFASAPSTNDVNLYDVTGFDVTKTDNFTFGKLEQGGYTQVASYNDPQPAQSKIRVRTQMDGLPAGYISITRSNTDLKYRVLVFDENGVTTYDTGGFVTNDRTMEIPNNGTFRIQIGTSANAPISPYEGLGIDVYYAKTNVYDGFVRGSVWAWISNTNLYLSGTNDVRFLYKGIVQSSFEAEIQNAVKSIDVSGLGVTAITYIVYKNGNVIQIHSVDDIKDAVPLGYIYNYTFYAMDDHIIANRMPMFDIKQRTGYPTYINFRRLGYKVLPTLQTANDPNFAYFGTSERITNVYDTSNFPYVWDKDGLHQYVSTIEQNTTTISGKKILTIGDSITKRGYYQYFINQASGATFVGTQTSQYHSMMCEGYSGADIDDVIGSSGPFWNPISQELDFGYYCSQNSIAPDIVTIMFGLNEGGTPAAYFSNMQALIDSIMDYSSSVHVFVIIPFGEAYEKWYGTGAMYAQRFKLIELLQCQCYGLTDCTLIPAYYVIDDDTDYETQSVAYGVGGLNMTVIKDGVHPLENTGFKKLANIIYNYLK